MCYLPVSWSNIFVIRGFIMVGAVQCLWGLHAAARGKVQKGHQRELLPEEQIWLSFDIKTGLTFSNYEYTYKRCYWHQVN